MKPFRDIIREALQSHPGRTTKELYAPVRDLLRVDGYARSYTTQGDTLKLRIAETVRDLKGEGLAQSKVEDSRVTWWPV